MRLISRAEWGARPRRSATGLNVSVATAHWGGDSPGPIEHDECAAWLRSWQNLHMDANGWSDLAYNLACCQHGYVFEGRGKGTRSGANGTNEANGASYAIVYIGGTPAPFTDEAKVAFNEAADYLGASLNWGHRDWVSTGCPGDEIYEWVHAGHAGHPADPSPTEEEDDVPQAQFYERDIDLAVGEHHAEIGLPPAEGSGGIKYGPVVVSFSSPVPTKLRVIVHDQEGNGRGLPTQDAKGLLTIPHGGRHGGFALQPGDTSLQVELVEPKHVRVSMACEIGPYTPPS